MAFNEDLARELLEDRDRDHARFFAGRDEEIRSFDAAVREAGRSRQTVFRVFQGAPGAGKTSLLARLREIRSDEVLFVDVAKKHLADDGALAGRVRDAAGSTATRIVSTVLKSIGSTLRMQPAGDALGAAVEDKTVEKSRIVLLMDEAHRVDGSVGDVLVDLHTIGLGVPAVFLFSGLGHTADRIRNLDGLSRLAENAVVHMDAMADGECEESTRMMLEELRVVGTGDEREGLAEMAAKLSFGWPQHLHCAQTAVCRELLRTDGVVVDVDADAVLGDTARRRDEYYRRRISGTALNAAGGTLTAAVVGRVTTMAAPPGDEVALAGICREEMHRTGLDANPDFGSTPGEYASLLLEKGVLTPCEDGIYDVAIPSMADWLDGQASGQGQGRGRRRRAAGRVCRD